MKKRFVFSIALLLIILIPNWARATADITLKIDGEVIQSDVPPFIENGRTMVPIRFIGEKLNMKVSFEDGMFEDTKMAVLKDVKGRKIFSDEVLFTSSDGIMYNTGDPSVDPGMIIRHDRAFVPIRYIANALHMDVSWDKETRTVSLKTNKKDQVYPLFFSIDKYDDKGNHIGRDKIAAKEFSIVYHDGQYLFTSKGSKDYMTKKNTINSYVEYIYSDEFPYANQRSQENFYKTELTLYGNNNFIMNADGTEIVGISAN